MQALLFSPYLFGSFGKSYKLFCPMLDYPVAQYSKSVYKMCRQ